MATNEEILKSRIIGFIEPLVNSDNARINVIGFKNLNGEYERINKERASQIFYPIGKVFAPSHHTDIEKYGISSNSFIEFSVKQSNKDASYVNADDYIRDLSKPVIQRVFTPIISIDSQSTLEFGYLTQDEIFSCINKNDFKEISGAFFLKHQNCLYGLLKFDKSSESIKPVVGKEANIYKVDDETYKNKCIKFNESNLFIGNINKIPFCKIGLIDCMDEKQLGDWFKEKLKSTAESEKILSIKKEAFQEFSTAFKETNRDIDEIRLKRIKRKIDLLEFTYSEIKELLSLDSVLTQKLTLTLQEMKSDFQSKWVEDLVSEKNILENEINKLKQEKETLSAKTEKLESGYNKKLDMLENSFSEKKCKLENQLSETEKKYKTIRENYDLLVESLALQSSQNTRKVNSDVIPLKPIVFKAEGEKFSVLEEDEGYGYFKLLKENLELEDLQTELKEQLNRDSELFIHKACFVPSVSWAYFYAKAVRNSKLYTIHVEHDWLHYKDFIDNGLLDVLKSCDEQKGVNHILVFDSLNLTQPECGLKPLLDVIAGYSMILPVFNNALPKNLKIFATILPFRDENKIGLPLNKESFVNWGQISTPDDRQILPVNFMDCEKQTGYFEPKDLDRSSVQIKEWVNNGYFAE